MLILLLLLIISLAIAVDHLTKKRRYELTKNIPGPTVLPLIGCPYVLIQRGFKGMLEDFSTINPTTTGGRIQRIWIGPNLMIITSDLKDLEVILGNSKHTSKALSYYEIFKSTLGNGLFVCSGRKWQYRRKLFAPLVGVSHFNNLVHIADEQCNIFLDILKGYVGKSTVDICPIVSKVVWDIFTEFGTGVKFHAQTNDKLEVFKATEELSKIMLIDRASFMYHLEITFKILWPRLHRAHKKYLEIFDKTFNDIILNRKQFLNQAQNNASVTENGNIEGKNYLEALLQSANEDGKPYSNTDILRELFSGIFAGHGTSANTFPFTLYCISRHRAVQEKLIEEIRDVFNDDLDACLDLKKINQLKYMEMVIKESLRLYPAAAYLGRLITEDSEINGRIFPKDTNVIIPVMHVHRDPEIYPDPLEFRPERFVEKGSINPFAYLPFSAGPRNCLGQKMGMLTPKLLLFKILSKYELLPSGPEPSLDHLFVTRSTNGVHLGLKERVLLTK